MKASKVPCSDYSPKLEAPGDDRRRTCSKLSLPKKSFGASGQCAASDRTRKFRISGASSGLPKFRILGASLLQIAGPLELLITWS